MDSFIHNLVDKLNLNRLYLAELPNEFSIQRLLTLFNFDRYQISFFKWKMALNNFVNGRRSQKCL